MCWTGWRPAMLIVPMLVIVLAARPMLVGGQEATPATDADGVLVSVAVPSLPGPSEPGVEVWLMRLALDPGVVLSPSPDLGVSLLHVEQGQLTFIVEGTVEVVRADGFQKALTAKAGTPIEVMLDPGETLVTGSGNRTGVRNGGNTTATVLSFMVFSPIEEVAVEEEANATAIDQMTGVQPQLLSVGRGSLPEGPGTLVIERVTLASDERSDVDREGGVEVGTVERGTIRLGVTAGEALVWSSAMSPTPIAEMTGPETIRAGTERVLRPGNGYALSTGSTGVWQVEGNLPVTILRGVVEPASAATPAQ